VMCARHVLTIPDPEERVVSWRNFRSFVALRVADLSTCFRLLNLFLPANGPDLRNLSVIL